jgi:hemoglobin
MTNSFLEDTVLTDSLTAESNRGKSLFERFGGRATLERVHIIFYDKLYAHPWLSSFFIGINQKLIENQQSDFFSQLTGGPKNYSGRMPQHAHAHMFISEELFLVRHELLKESLIEGRVSSPELEEWLKIDMAFKKVLSKQSPRDCQKRYVDEDIVVIPNPNSRKAS